MMGNLALAVPTVSGELLPSRQGLLAGGKASLEVAPLAVTLGCAWMWGFYR
jgi:hypothetical protein